MTTLYMFSQISCYPCGAVLLKKKKQFARNASADRLAFSVYYMLGERYISFGVTHKRRVLFPCGRTQHVRRMRSSIASVKNSVLEFRSARFFK